MVTASVDVSVRVSPTFSVNALSRYQPTKVLVESVTVTVVGRVNGILMLTSSEGTAVANSPTL